MVKRYKQVIIAQHNANNQNTQGEQIGRMVNCLRRNRKTLKKR